MSMTEVKSNTYEYSRKKLSADQVYVTNNLGRAVVYGEFVVLGGYFGFVEEQGGIANGASGYISIMPYEVRSEQVEATDTFTVGNVLYFEPGGSSAAGTFVDTATGTTTAVGIISGEEGTGGAQTAVMFVPYLQKVNNSGLDTRLTAAEAAIAVEQAEPKTVVFKVTADATSGLTITGLAIGDEIIGAHVICTATNASGTLKITDGTHDVTDGMACSTDTAVDYAATIDDAYSTLTALPKVVSVGGTTASTRGILVVTYIPA